ncbi:MAG: sigma-70 family RNA polymerase sigma factor [Gemmataceae bacterium]
MPDRSVHTAQLHDWLAAMRAGDPAACDALLRGVGGRLESLARGMLARDPRVGRWVEAEDLLQNALLRLLRSLESVRPGSMREFYGLAAAQMRRELIDLARGLYGPHGPGANLAPDPPADVTAAGESSSVMDDLTTLHEQIERLPAEEREVVGLIHYHGWPQAQVAQLFGVTVRTVQRRWESATAKLKALLEG